MVRVGNALISLRRGRSALQHEIRHQNEAETSRNPFQVLARSERFELPTLGIEIRCSIQLSYERVPARLPDLAGLGQRAAGPSASGTRAKSLVPDGNFAPIRMLNGLPTQ